MCAVSSSGRPAAGSSSSTSAACRRPRGRPRPAAGRGPERPDLGVRVGLETDELDRVEHVLAARADRSAFECSWTIATLSKTDSSSIACSVWNVRRTPQRARRKCAIFSRSRRTRDVPAAGLTNPLSTLKNVVLPAPLGPIRPHVPSSNLTLIPSSGVTPPKRTVRSETSINSAASLAEALRPNEAGASAGRAAPCPLAPGR